MVVAAVFWLFVTGCGEVFYAAAARRDSALRERPARSRKSHVTVLSRSGGVFSLILSEIARGIGASAAPIFAIAGKLLNP
jgi:hypothetical protein